MLLVLFAACNFNEKPQIAVDDSARPEEEEIVIGLNYQCIDDDSRFSNVSVEATEIETVFRLQWQSDGGEAYINFKDESGREQWRRAQSTEEIHSALSVGLRPLNEAILRPAVLIGEEMYCGETQVVQTGNLHSALPQTSLQGDVRSGFLVAPVTTAESRFATIMDGSGSFVWSKEVPYIQEFTDSAPFTQTLLSNDGQSLMYFTFDSYHSEDAYYRELSFDGTVLRVESVPGWHLSFTEVKDGVIAGLGWSTYTNPDGSEMFGDTIVELDPDGNQRVVWNSFEAFPPSDPLYDVGQVIEDWMHVNYLTYDSERNKYLITIGRTGSVAQIDRESGEIDWLISGQLTFATDFQTQDLSQLSYIISYPHSVQRLSDDRILVFNRAFVGIDFGMECSEVTELQMDFTERKVKGVWSAPSEECLIVSFLGNSHRLPSGETLAVWSDKGQVDIFDEESKSIWKLNLDLGAIFGFAQWEEVLD